MTASLAAVEEISVDAVVAAVLSELNGNFHFKEEQRVPLKAFLVGKDVSTLFPAGFGKSLVTYHHGSPQCQTFPCTSRKPGPVDI